MASLRLNDDVNSFFCGGTLIHPRVVLTAGHCLTDPDTGKNYSDIGIPSFNPPLVRVGGYWAFEEPSNKAELFTVVRQVVNPKFAVPFTPPLTYNFLNNDVALLLLDRPSTMPVVKLLGPPTPSNSKPKNPVPDWSKVTVMGWGLDSSSYFPEKLQEVQQQVLPLSVCQTEWGAPDPPWANSEGEQQVRNTFRTNSMMCAGGNWPVGDKGFCPGDSGGPLIVKGANWAQDVQIGSVSFTAGDCIGASVYANIPSVWHWINSTVFALTGNYLNEPFKPKTGSVSSPGPQIAGFNGQQYPTKQSNSVQPGKAAQTLKVFATPQYSVTAGMATTTSSPSKGPFIGAQRGRAPPNVRGGSQNSTVATSYLYKRGSTTVQTALQGNPLRMAVTVNGRSLQQGTTLAIPGGRVVFPRSQVGANWRVTVEQPDLSVQMSQPAAAGRLQPWLDVRVTLKACP